MKESEREGQRRNFVLILEEAQMFMKRQQKSVVEILEFFALQGRFFGVSLGILSQKTHTVTFCYIKSGAYIYSRSHEWRGRPKLD